MNELDTMVLNKAPLKIDELIEQLKEYKKDFGNCEVWMLSKEKNVDVGDNVTLESVGTVSGFAVASNDYKAVFFISGKDYLKI